MVGICAAARGQPTARTDIWGTPSQVSSRASLGSAWRALCVSSAALPVLRALSLSVLALSALALSALAWLARLAVSAQLSRLIVLLALTWLPAGILAAEGLNLATKAFEAVQRGIRALRALLLTTGGEGPLGLMEVIAQPLKTACDLRLGPVPVGIDAAAKPVRRALKPRFEIGLIHALERAAKLVGGGPLPGVELTRGVADVLLELRQVVGHPLPIGGKLLDLASDRLGALRALRGAGPPLFQLLDAIRLVLLHAGQAIGLARHRTD